MTTRSTEHSTSLSTTVLESHEREATLHLTLRAPQTPDEKIRRLARKIEVCQALNSEEKMLVHRAIAQLPANQAITQIFFDVVGPALARGELVEELFDETEALFEECGAPLEQKAAAAVYAAADSVQQELEEWQEELAGEVEDEAKRRVERVKQVNQDARKALQQLQSLAASAEELADRMDRLEPTFHTGLRHCQESIVHARRMRRR